jgi:hypothetical protein
MATRGIIPKLPQNLDTGDLRQVQVEKHKRGTAGVVAAGQVLKIPQCIVPIADDAEVEIKARLLDHVFNNEYVCGVIFNEQDDAGRSIRGSVGAGRRIAIRSSREGRSKRSILRRA